MRVLVTGGAGYIGSHAAKALAVAGHEPIVLDDLSTGHQQAVQWGPVVVGALGDPAALDAAFATEPEAVMHFAAKAYVGESMQQPRKYLQDNVVGSLALLERVLDAGGLPFVFSSTCSSYGVPQTIPITEDHPQRPVNPYGEGKLYIEKALAWYGELHGLPWMALRYFNAAGADPDGELGEDHDPETHLVPRAIAATRDDYRLKINGTDYPTPDGTAVRDYIHVTDLAEAHVKALDQLAGGSSSVALNLGTGTGTSVREVVAAVERVADSDVAVVEVGRRAGDPPELVADPTAAQKILGWKANLSDIDTIVETALRWHTRERAE